MNLLKENWSFEPGPLPAVSKPLKIDRNMQPEQLFLAQLFLDATNKSKILRPITAPVIAAKSPRQ